jgi:hypothetical protein
MSTRSHKYGRQGQGVPEDEDEEGNNALIGSSNSVFSPDKKSCLTFILVIKTKFIFQIQVELMHTRLSTYEN